MLCNCNCDCGENQKLNFDLLEHELIKYENIDGSLITVLQKAQVLYGYLPADLLLHISRRLNIKLAKIMGVVTFYTQFRTTPTGKNLILLCQGTACHVNGSADIEKAVGDYLGVREGEISGNGLFTYNNAACLGCCSLSPVMMIGAQTYGNLTKDKAVKILGSIAKEEAAK